MSKPRSLVVLALVALLRAAAPAAAEKPPRYSFDREFDYSRLHSFDVRQHPSKTQTGAAAESLQPRVFALLEELLVAKGYRRDQEQPDFVVTYDTMVAEDYSSTSWAGHAEVARGLLAIRLTESGEEEPFWIGADAAGLTGRLTADKAWKKVDRATRRILAGFPPPPQ
jgi:hypothetical protein